MDQEHPASLDFRMGELHGRVAALENVVSNQGTTLIKMDGKLDTIQLSLAEAVGGRERMRALVKFMSALLAGLGVIGGAVMWFLQHVTFRLGN